MTHATSKFKFQLGCIVSLTRKDRKEHSHGNDDTDESNSISGILIDERSGFVLTHASLLASLTDTCSLPSILKAATDGFVPLDNLLDKHTCEILVEDRDVEDGTSSVLFKGLTPKQYYTELLNCSIQNNSKTIHKHTGQLLCVFKCEKFEKTLQQLMPVQSGWKFNDSAPSRYDDTGSLSQVDKSGPNENYSKNNNDDNERMNEAVHALLPCFILIRLQSWSGSCKSKISIQPASLCRRGDMAEVIGTPFGSLSPDVFINSYSRGVVCNVAGPGNVLILTDARCIPGTEGGALIMTDRHGNKSLAGIVTAPLCWKNGEWIGLALVCSVVEVLNSLHRVTSLDVSYPNQVDPATDVKLESGAVGQSVVLIRCGSTWGSGVLIDQSKRLILTCSHVIKWGSTKTVLLRFGVDDKWLKADILFCSPSGEQFDLAMLQTRLDPPPHALSLTLASSPATQGQHVCVTGHALFDEDHALESSVTSGVISKMTSVRGVMVMLQTTCAVHAGASGGALTDQHGHLLGVVVCNAKDTAAGASFPHVNLCVPLHTIWPVIEQYQTTGDKRVLKSLHVTDKHVKTLWNLGSFNYTTGHQGPLDSKL